MITKNMKAVTSVDRGLPPTAGGIACSIEEDQERAFAGVVQVFKFHRGGDSDAHFQEPVDCSRLRRSGYGRYFAAGSAPQRSTVLVTGSGDHLCRCRHLSSFRGVLLTEWCSPKRMVAF